MTAEELTMRELVKEIIAAELEWLRLVDEILAVNPSGPWEDAQLERAVRVYDRKLQLFNMWGQNRAFGTALAFMDELVKRSRASTDSSTPAEPEILDVDHVDQVDDQEE